MTKKCHRHLDALRSSLVTASLLLLIAPASTGRSEDVDQTGYGVTRLPLLRASIPVELIDPAMAEDVVPSAATQDAAEEIQLQKMEAELLKTLDASSSSQARENPAPSRVSKVHISNVAAPTAVPAAMIKEAKVPNVQPTSANSGSLVQDGPTAAILKELNADPTLTKSRPKNVVIGGETTQKLAIAESQVKILSRELDISRRSLTSAERRIEELSLLVKRPEHTNGTITNVEDSIDAVRGSLRPDLEHDEFVVDAPTRKQHIAPLLDDAAEPTIEMPANSRSSEVATVAVDRAPLRVAPGRQESALYVMPRNTEVTLELRSGEWYRVVTPSGVRGWISGAALRFNTGVSAASTVRIGGFRTSLESVVR